MFYSQWKNEGGSDYKKPRYSHASNVCGKILPLTEILEISHRKGALVLLDAAQSAGVIPVNCENVDLMAFTGHKSLLGPPGTGGLYVREGIHLTPWREGGTGSHSDYAQQPDNMPERLESGTLNGPGIAGLLKGVKFVRETGIENIRRHETTLTTHLIEGLSQIQGLTIYGYSTPSQNVSVISFTLEGIDSGELGDVLENTFGIISRTGLHCAPLAHKALGIYPSGTVRLSPGYFNTIEDMDYAVNAISEIASIRKL